MVARIRLGKKITGAVSYNERKVTQGAAVLIDAAGYWKDGPDLSLGEKLHMLHQHTAMNTRAEYPCMHVSLNFHPAELLSQAKLRAIAADYMERIGFGAQPYLVYEHYDAAHPHIHIVAPTITRQGKLLDLNFIAVRKSEPARKAIEARFDLVVAEGRTPDKTPVLAASIAAARYGKAETYQEIARVVRSVWRSYKFTNLQQFDTVLRQYGITIDTGTAGSVTQAKRGLRYSMIDSTGKKMGVPMKASRIPDQPTLARLEKTFVFNRQPKDKYKAALRRTIDQVLALPACKTLEDFAQAMKARQVGVHYHVSTGGNTYGISFTDNINRVCFNGRELGPAASIAGIDRRLQTTGEQPAAQVLATPPVAGAPAGHASGADPASGEVPQYPPATAPVAELIYFLLRYEHAHIEYYDPYRKKRKRPGKELSR